MGPAPGISAQRHTTQPASPGPGQHDLSDAHLACRLTCAFAFGFEAAWPCGGFPHVVVGCGAAVAGAFRASGLENKWVGEYSDSIKEDVNERVGAVSQSVREAADTLKNEIKDAGTETFDRVKKAGMEAAEAAGPKVKAP